MYIRPVPTGITSQPVQTALSVLTELQPIICSLNKALGIGRLTAACWGIKKNKDGTVAVCTFRRALTKGEIDGKKAYCPDLMNEVEIFDKRY